MGVWVGPWVVGGGPIGASPGCEGHGGHGWGPPVASMDFFRLDRSQFVELGLEGVVASSVDSCCGGRRILQ